MRVSLKWLADYVDLVLPPEELAHRLTMSGTEVGKIERIGAFWQNIFVGRVTALVPHPNADRLQLVTIDYGRATVTVVAGAFNIKVSDKVPLALEGATVRDAYAGEPRMATVKATKLRGIVSQGMACSQKELGISDDHTGIMVLDPDAEIGRPLQDELGDVIFELEVTPNRPDLLSMIGVAREVAALTGQQLRLPAVEYQESGPPIDSLITVEIPDADLSSRYSATYLEGVRIGPSPKWMRDRIVAAGMRPINNIVDVTNYVMLEWGQPLHAFDYDTLRGHRIIVRRARIGEHIVSLDGVDRELSPEMLTIADAERAVAVAGIMGGAETEVTDQTTRILLESANFNPVSIRRTSRALHLPSEASRRFEKGLPPQQTVDAARRATQLMLELGGGTAARGVADCYPRQPEPRAIILSPRDVRRVLGIQMDAPQIAQALGRLGLAADVTDGEVVTKVPAFRGDLTLPADLAEEIARMIGYDAIPSTMLSGRMPLSAGSDALHWISVLREVFVAAGFAEVICYSLTNKERMKRLLVAGDAERGPAEGVHGEQRELAAEIDSRMAWTAWPPLGLVNPLSEDSDSLRITSFASILETLRDNLRHERHDVAIFEIDRVYIPRDGELPEERRILTAAVGALRSGRNWGEEVTTDFFDLKGLAEVAIGRMGIGAQEYVAVEHPVFQPGQAAAIRILTAQGSPSLVGVLGEVHPRVRANFDIGERVYLLALDFERLLQHATLDRRYELLPRYPAVLQDIAVVVADEVAASAVRRAIFESGGELVRDVELFDLYRGATIGDGKKSLAYRITFLSNTRTLTDQEVNAVRERIVAALTQRFGAVLRG